MSLTLWNKCQKMAAWLDKNEPGWHEKINLDMLDMAQCPFCIAGQAKPEERISSLTVPSFVTEVWQKETLGWHDKDSDIGMNREYFDKLNDYWTTLVKQRQN